jgi:hypothetical protein
MRPRADSSPSQAPGRRLEAKNRAAPPVSPLPSPPRRKASRVRGCAIARRRPGPRERQSGCELLEIERPPADAFPMSASNGDKPVGATRKKFGRGRKAEAGAESVVLVLDGDGRIASDLGLHRSTVKVGRGANQQGNENHDRGANSVLDKRRRKRTRLIGSHNIAPRRLSIRRGYRIARRISIIILAIAAPLVRGQRAEGPSPGFGAALDAGLARAVCFR